MLTWANNPNDNKRRVHLAFPNLQTECCQLKRAVEQSWLQIPTSEVNGTHHKSSLAYDSLISIFLTREKKVPFN